MVQNHIKPLTLETFLALPETKPASEFIDRKIVQKPMPLGKHSALQSGISELIETEIRERRIACTFPELRCTFNGSSIVPDIAVFVWQRIPTDEDGEIANVFSIAPDWIIEILSPGQSIARVTKKIIHCLEHGTQMGWLVDPVHKSVLIYQPQRDIEVVETAEEPQAILSVPSFMTEMTMTIENLFALLQL